MTLSIIEPSSLYVVDRTLPRSITNDSSLLGKLIKTPNNLYNHTFSKKVSGLLGSKISLQYMKKSPVAFSTARLNESAEQNSLTSQFGYTFSKKVSGCEASNTSLQYITVTKFSVSERLMIL